MSALFLWLLVVAFGVYGIVWLLIDIASKRAARS